VQRFHIINSLQLTRLACGKVWLVFVAKLP
jgi:hypothetical protein